MQRYTIFFIAVNALHVSGGSPAYHQELKLQNCTHSIWYVLSKLDIYQMLCVQFFELLVMGGGTARNM